MNINKKTKIFFSISSFPGNKGSILHNYLFRKFSMNSIYIPLGIKNLNLFLRFAKEIRVAGFSVSMPFKKKIVKYLSKKSKEVMLTKSCNTVFVNDNKLTGFNTDYIAIYQILKNYKKLRDKKIQILGNGATCETVLIALKNLQFKNVFVYSRKGSLSKKNNVNFLPWKNRNKKKYDFLINTTPIGMNKLKIDEAPISNNNLKNLKVIIDFPIPSQKISNLERRSKKLKIKYYSGNDIHFLQGINQSQIYLQKKISLEVCKKIKKILY